MNSVEYFRGVPQCASAVGIGGEDAEAAGLNLGAPAGGSLADHLHQHVVPRWSGDANFITVIADTKVLPQLLADTRRLLADAWDAPPPDGA